MQVPSETLDADAAYKLLVGAIIPRPIAWVTTVSDDGVVNAAPFSAFTFVSNRPPMVAVSIGRKAGVLKDTARNIIETREFVVNIATQALLEPLHMSAVEYPPDVSEVSELNIAVAASARVRPPRIAAAPASLECRLHQVLEFGDFRTNLMVGEVLMFHVRDDLIANGKIDSEQLDPICRLGGPKYATLGEVMTLQTIGVTPK